MAKNSVNLNDRLLDAKIMIENSLSDEEIKNAVKSYGYDEAKLNAGKVLYEQLQDIVNKQKKEYGEQYEATAETRKAWDNANLAYMKTLKIARFVLQDNVRAQNSMMLNGDRKQSLSGWLVQAEAFYKNLTDDSGLMAKMQAFSYTVNKLNSEYDLVKDVIDKNLKRKRKPARRRKRPNFVTGRSKNLINGFFKSGNPSFCIFKTCKKSRIVCGNLFIQTPSFSSAIHHLKKKRVKYLLKNFHVFFKLQFQ